ncbi:heterokaryon incompatibility protein-domain-containing protein [Apiospora arundinis]
MQLQGSIPKYAALSYVWGDAADTEEIVVDGQPFQVTMSLNSALQQFGLTYTRNGRKSLFLWADAVCINQQDLAERGQQVSILELIYSKATLVISWLGPSTESTASGTADLEILSENTAFYENDTELSSGKKAWNAIDEPNHHAY